MVWGFVPRTPIRLSTQQMRTNCSSTSPRFGNGGLARGWCAQAMSTSITVLPDSCGMSFKLTAMPCRKAWTSRSSPPEARGLNGSLVSRSVGERGDNDAQPRVQPDPPTGAVLSVRSIVAAGRLTRTLAVMSRRHRAHGPLPTRRRVIIGALGASLALHAFRSNAALPPSGSDRRWYEAAVSMKRLAESWGDQPYGAVVVLAGELLGEGPSRVVKNRDPQAHAEHEAIRDAQRRLGRAQL